MCECVEKINEELAERKSNTRVKIPLLLESDLSIKKGIRLEIVTEKIDRSKRGKNVPVFGSFCPFCGAKA